MSSGTTPAEPSVALEPEDGEWVPASGSLYRMTVEKYEEMIASEVFTKRDRLHLIQGLLVTKMTGPKMKQRSAIGAC